MQQISAASKSKTNESSINNDVVSSLLGSISLHDCNTSISNEELFKQPPPLDDCPICFLQLPVLGTGWRYKSCCGKLICSGCIYAISTTKNHLCPFCRTPTPSSDEANEREKKRMALKDAHAINNQGSCYFEGSYGYPKDLSKALELWHRSGELGYAGSYYNIGSLYFSGNGVERDDKKARHYFELAAITGDVDARFNLGLSEERLGNWDRVLKHFTIAVVFGGDDESLKKIKQLYTDGLSTKEDYDTALRAYQTYLGEVKSDQRDKAAAARDDFKYY